MEDMGFSSAFNVQLHVPALKEADIRTVLSSLNAFSATDVSHSCLLLPSCFMLEHVSLICFSDTPLEIFCVLALGEASSQVTVLCAEVC